jgi:hypothetical protein
MSHSSAFVHARAVRWVSDEPFPGLIEVELSDAAGELWTFVDKYPIFDPDRVFGPSTDYPVPVEIACTVLERTVVSSANPWGLETGPGKPGPYNSCRLVDEFRRPKSRRSR